MRDYSNFITPPDFINPESEDFNNETLLIIDADWIDIEAIATFLKTSDVPYNIYLYSSDMDNLAWLHGAEQRANTLIINTEQSSISNIKDRWADLPKAYYYGPKKFLMNSKYIKNPLAYFFR